MDKDSEYLAYVSLGLRIGEAYRKMADEEAKLHNDESCDPETCTFCMVDHWLDKQARGEKEWLGVNA